MKTALHGEHFNVTEIANFGYQTGIRPVRLCWLVCLTSKYVPNPSTYKLNYTNQNKVDKLLNKQTRTFNVICESFVSNIIKFFFFFFNDATLIVFASCVGNSDIELLLVIIYKQVT